METLRKGGAFVYVMGWDAGDAFEERVTEAVRRGDTEHAGFPAENGQIVCIGSHVIAELLLDFPALLYPLIGAGDATLYAFEQWDADPRFQNPFELDTRLSTRMADLRSKLEAPGAIIRVIGAAGVGKTRTVQEVLASSELAPSVLYAPEPPALTPAFRHYLVHSPSVRCTLVVDEVDDSTADVLTNEFGMMKGGVRLVMISLHAAGWGGRDTIELDGLDDDALTRIIQSIAAGLDTEVAQSIARVCGRSPKLAALLAGRVRDDPDLAAPHRLLRDPGVQAGLGRYLAIHVHDPAWQALSTLSLLTHVGWAGDADEESETLFTACGLNAGAARRDIEELHERFGIAPLAGRFRYVSPDLLADHLASRQIGSWTRSMIRSFLNAIEPQLAQRFARRLRHLAGALPDPTSVEEAIFGEAGPFRNLAEIEGTRLPSLLHQLAPAFPWPALLALERLIQPATDDQLRLATQSRRDVVWALEALLWRDDTFERAVALLLRLAVAENEPSISNNASAVFAETFQTHLGRTAATPTVRFRVLRSIAAHADPAVRVLASRALIAALRSEHIVRLGNPPRDVDEMPAEAWQPHTYGEWFDANRSALALLHPLLTDSSPDVREAAMQALVVSVSVAVRFPVTTEWLAAAEHLIGAPYSLRAPLVDAVLWEVSRQRRHDVVGAEVDMILGREVDSAEVSDHEDDDDAASTAEEAAQVGDEEALPSSPAEQHEFQERIINLAHFVVRLRGDDFSSRLRRAVTRDSYAASAHDWDAETQRLRRQLEELAREGFASPALIEAEWPWMAEAHRMYGWLWADVLGTADSDRIVATALERAARGSLGAAMFLSLYEIAYGRAVGDEAWVDRRAEELRAAGAPTLAFDLLWRAGYAAERVQSIALLLTDPGVGPHAIASLGYPPWGKVIPVNDVVRLLQAGDGSATSASSAISFISSYLHHQPESRQALRELALDSLSNATGSPTSASHDDYEWARVAQAYVEESSAEVMQAALEYVAARDRALYHDIAEVVNRAWKVGDKAYLLREILGPWLDAETAGAWHVRQALERLPIAEIGVQPLHDWIAEKPESRARVIARILGAPHAPVSDAYAMLLTEFAEHGVGDAFFGALIEGTFWGSMSARTRGLIARVEPIAEDIRSAVREWARSTLRSLRASLEREENWEDEQRFWG